MIDLVFQCSETRIVKQRRQPGIKARRTNSGGSILVGLLKLSKGFVCVSKSGINRRDVGTIYLAMLRAGLELVQNLFRPGRRTCMCVTDRQLEVRSAKRRSRKRLVTFYAILPALYRDVNVRNRILVV